MVARTLRRLVEAATASYQDTIDVLLAGLAADDIRTHQIRRAERAANHLQVMAQHGAEMAARLGHEAERLEAQVKAAAAVAERLERLERLERE
jgi:hypothetical protein